MGITRTAPSVLLLALAACAPAGTPTTAAPSPTTAAPSQTTAVPDAGAARDCGSWTLAQGEQPPAEAYPCLLDAVRERRPARLVVTEPTVEGDPVTTTFLARADGRVEVTTDARLDRFGSGRVERQTCDGPTPLDGRPTFAICSTPRPA